MLRMFYFSQLKKAYNYSYRDLEMGLLKKVSEALPSLLGKRNVSEQAKAYQQLRMCCALRLFRKEHVLAAEDSVICNTRVRKI